MDLPRYAVLYKGTDGTEHEDTVTVLHQDQLRAELLAPRLGLPSIKEAPMHYTSLWVYSALTREKKYDGKPQAWKSDCLGFQALEPDQGALPGQPETAADPTQPVADAVLHSL